METVVSNQESLTNRWQKLYGPVAAEMVAVEDHLRAELRSPYDYIDELIQHSFRLGGKRMRPALVLLCGKACGRLTESHTILASVVEMIHTATLLHDDVLDEASVRRHLATVNSRWNNEASILTGDYLFSHAFYLAATLESTFACQVIGKSTNRVCEGELLQVANRGNYLLSEQDYYKIIDGKTAALVACSCALGAFYAGANEATVEQFERFGRELGLAFQIADDLLDLTGEEAITGKSLGTDVEKEKLTLPWIRLLQQQSPAERDRLIQCLSSHLPEHQQLAKQALFQSDGVSYAKQRATLHVERALSALALLDASESAQTLRRLAAFVIQRKH